MHVADPLIRLALAEDLGPGDVTTDALVPPDATGEAVIWAKEKMVLAGLDVARRVFTLVDPSVEWDLLFSDGDFVDRSSKVKVATVKGSLRSLLYGERTALNFLQRLSGIATWVRHHVEQLPQGKTRLGGHPQNHTGLAGAGEDGGALGRRDQITVLVSLTGC